MTASTLTFYDAAYPPNPAPHADGFCFYIGGDAYHVWTRAEVEAQTARYRLPVFVRSNPPGPGAAADVAEAVRQLRAIGAPKGIVVVWDMETAADPSYIRGVYTGLRKAGYLLMAYGTQSDVFGNQAPDGLYFGADWSDVQHLDRGDAITQWVSYAAYDLDLAEATLPFWDTQAAPPSHHASSAPPEEDTMQQLKTGKGESDTWSWDGTPYTNIGFLSDPSGDGVKQTTVRVALHHQGAGEWDVRRVTLTPAEPKKVLTFAAGTFDGVKFTREDAGGAVGVNFA